MNVSLIVENDNYKVGFYSKIRLSFMPSISYKSITGIGQINREILVESPNLTIEINARLAPVLFENPLVGFAAELYADNELIFSGKISSIALSQDNITFSIEA
ncbi:MAG: hypothetical protein V9H25_06655 [Candidatus Competibacter sp.]